MIAQVDRDGNGKISIEGELVERVSRRPARHVLV